MHDVAGGKCEVGAALVDSPVACGGTRRVVRRAGSALRQTSLERWCGITIFLQGSRHNGRQHTPSHTSPSGVSHHASPLEAGLPSTLPAPRVEQICGWESSGLANKDQVACRDWSENIRLRMWGRAIPGQWRRRAASSAPSPSTHSAPQDRQAASGSRSGIYEIHSSSALRWWTLPCRHWQILQDLPTSTAFSVAVLLFFRRFLTTLPCTLMMMDHGNYGQVCSDLGQDQILCQ